MESIYGKNKDYLSFSAVRLWLSNKDGYRKHYYEGAAGIDTVYTRFGKTIAETLESRDFTKYPELAKIPFYSVSEHPLEAYFDGVKVIAYLDLFEPETFSIGEVKTGVKSAWDKVKVRQWDQLPWYSLMVKETYGKVDPRVHLIWLQTEFKEQKGMLQNSELQLTGKMQIFPRHIVEYERKRIREQIINAAKEIKDDYATYRRTTSSI